MGRPRLIIVIRHAQSEGNLNRQIHQTVPDHRVRLTQEGWSQARDAGRRLRALLRPSDTLQFYTSPYRRTRETTDGMLQTLTAEEGGPSPFPRGAVKVWEEPRLREQDFGNFQPDSQAMEEMWRQRAEYGHFFYRIPNGESAADAYDRISGFNETLFRSFEEDDFPSVCVLVTHGLMTRVFLMRWYHWSVEYFEDLRNVNHCEMVIMQRSPDSGKFQLQTELRTWSELRRKAAAERDGAPNTSRAITSPPRERRWGEQGAPRPHTKPIEATAEQDEAQPSTEACTVEDEEEAFPNLDPARRLGPRGTSDASVEPAPSRQLTQIRGGRDFGGSASGAATPVGASDEEHDYFARGGDQGDERKETDQEWEVKERAAHREKNHTPSEEERRRWVVESGMGSGALADALGDHRLRCGGGGGEGGGLGGEGGEDEEIREAEERDRSLRGSVY